MTVTITTPSGRLIPSSLCLTVWLETKSKALGNQILPSPHRWCSVGSKQLQLDQLLRKHRHNFLQLPKLSPIHFLGLVGLANMKILYLSFLGLLIVLCGTRHLPENTSLGLVIFSFLSINESQLTKKEEDILIKANML